MATVCVFDREMIQSLPPPMNNDPEASNNSLKEALSTIVHMIAPGVGTALDVAASSDDIQTQRPSGFLEIDNNMSVDPARSIDPQGFIGDRFVHTSDHAVESLKTSRSQNEQRSSARDESMYEM
ncbi:hypothetical protein SAMN02744133_10898 [Thalassospira xiamenensis M-5 = DSM 17429]|uniref:Uncharacterized protein n=1 Tax=Thalassospira xiamenensis M-5 = DSM 17429 TaxID=1123366 RepID=A0AB72UJQ7_9PROT|nr:hypothetical protein [Thalassospira xiamenensis]AJD54372.1 hypothetical protein TH3_21498 [Thalassospira xiamenensis M-5 = DSM 17429]SIT21665.1 hypothetical protein SAMN02744133_10898 [Thalassospira xiamenensis M-5 = DSM 17429]